MQITVISSPSLQYDLRHHVEKEGTEVQISKNKDDNEEVWKDCRHIYEY